jgi:hypothetical protein
MDTVTLTGVVSNPHFKLLPNGADGIEFTFICRDRQNPNMQRFWLVTYAPHPDFVNLWMHRLNSVKRCLIKGEMYYATGTKKQVSTYVRMTEIYPLMPWSMVAPNTSPADHFEKATGQAPPSPAHEAPPPLAPPPVDEPDIIDQTLATHTHP